MENLLTVTKKHTSADVLVESFLMVHIQPPIISAEKARKQANLWLLANIGNLLHGESPELRLNQQYRLYWQVKVILSNPYRKRVGQVGQLDIDAVTGEVLADIKSAEKEMRANSQILLDTIPYHAFLET